jgi:uncharacterized protein (DUF1778 family)
MLRTSEHPKQPRNARLQVRVPSDQKDLFQRAAALAGCTLSKLVIDSTHEAAARIVQQHDVIRLSRDAQIAFVSAVLAPSRPGARLKKAVRAYRRKSQL